MKNVFSPSILSFAILVAVAGLSGCGSDDSENNSNPVAGQPDDQTGGEKPPVVETPKPCGADTQLIFPAPYSATSASSITLRGRSGCDQITALTVNGVAATSSDNFANWQVKVPLTAGLNTLTATIAEGEQSQQLALAKIESNELLYSPADIVLSSDESTLYMIDDSRRQVLEIDMVSGARKLLSAATTEDNYAFGNMAGLVLDETNQKLYLTSRYIKGLSSNESYSGIMAVDLKNGSRSLILDPQAAASSDDLIRNVDSLVYDAQQQRFYLSTQGAIYWTSATPNSKVQLLSDGSTPDATNPFSRYANLRMVLDSSNQRLIVSDDGNGGDGSQVLAVDIDAKSADFGKRTILLATDKGLNRIQDISLQDATTALITDLNPDNSALRIYQLNIKDKSLNLIVDSSTVQNQRAIKDEARTFYQPSKQRLLISADRAKSIVAVDISQKNYQLLFSNTNPTISQQPQLFDELSRNALDAKNGQLYLETDDEQVVRVNLATGAREVFVDNLALSDDHYSSNAIDSMGFDAQQNALIITGYQRDNNTRETTGYVWAYSAADGTKTVITDNAKDTGSELNRPWDWVSLDAESGIVVDDTSSPSRYYRTNLSSGQRSEINVNLSGVPDRLEVEDMEISHDNSTLYVTDDSSNAGVYAIDIASGKARVITDTTTPDDGNALRLKDPEALALASDGKHVYVGDNSASALFKVNLKSGARQALIYDANTSTNSWAERIQGIAVDNEKQVLYTSCENAEVVLMMDEVTNEWVMVAE